MLQDRLRLSRPPKGSLEPFFPRTVLDNCSVMVEGLVRLSDRVANRRRQSLPIRGKPHNRTQKLLAGDGSPFPEKMVQFRRPSMGSSPTSSGKMTPGAERYAVTRQRKIGRTQGKGLRPAAFRGLPDPPLHRSVAAFQGVPLPFRWFTCNAFVGWTSGTNSARLRLWICDRILRAATAGFRASMAARIRVFCFRDRIGRPSR